ncbi:hypothetical protein D3C74_464280 [compost metagenome]
MQQLGAADRITAAYCQQQRNEMLAGWNGALGIRSELPILQQLLQIPILQPRLNPRIKFHCP